MKIGLLLLLVGLITLVQGGDVPEIPRILPIIPVTKAPEPYCCNKCPPVKVIIKKIVKAHVFKVNIPYPVFKQLKTTVLTKCPAKFKKVSPHKCVHYVKSKTTCPPGYFRVSDTSCLKVVILPPKRPNFKVECPKGYKKYGEMGCRIGKKHQKKFPKLPVFKKIKKVGVVTWTAKKTIKCPAGWIKKGKYHCVKKTKCPRGFTKTKRGFCQRTKVQCKNGYVRLGRLCIKNLRKCPKGWKYNSKEKTCTKTCKKECHGCKQKVWLPKKPKTCNPAKCPKLKCKAGWRYVKHRGSCCGQCVHCYCNGKFEPVCSGGVTYMNRCSARCLLGKKVVIRNGSCVSKCPKEPKKCPGYYKPVCGTDGITYINRCVARLNKKTVKSKGPCPAVC